MTHVDLFSGIGGFTLAAHWCGIQTLCFVEKDQRCREFLGKTWPRVTIHDDIKTFNGCPYSGATILTAGVPCQPASRAGKQRGEADDRWLWPEALRVLGEVRPAWAVFENPTGIGDVGLSGILAGVEAQNYTVRVFSVPACAVGAPHRRERYWIVAKSNEDGRSAWIASTTTSGHGSPIEPKVSVGMADSSGEGHQERRMQPGVLREEECGDSRKAVDVGRQDSMYHAGSVGGRQDKPECGSEERAPVGWTGADVGHTSDAGLEERQPEQDRLQCASTASHWSNFVWLPCADGKIRRAPDDSISLVDGLHRSLLGALGNSIVPQVAFQILKAIHSNTKPQ